MPETIQRHTRLFCVVSAFIALLLTDCATASAQAGTVENFTKINTALFQAADAALTQSAFSTPRAQTIQPVHVEPQIRSHLVGRVNSRIQQLKPAIVPILEQHGVPAGLAAVVAVESGGDPMAISSRGARGLWQLMPQTARRYGLVVDSIRDERIDIEKSTSAAAQYLNDLYAQFGSWPLTLAAYNWGEQNMTAAIRRTHTTDLSMLFASGALPAETHSYVPAVLARWSASADHSARKFIPVGAIVYADAQTTTTQSAEHSVPGLTASANLISITNVN
jgi:soluble lytic murein transglycosylase-like protein